MSWPKQQQCIKWICSDGKDFLDKVTAEEYERLLSLKALCVDVFGKDGSGHYGSLNGKDVYQGLIDHRDLFLKYLVRNGS